MRVENISDEFKESINDLLKNTNAKSIDEIVKHAKEFQSMEELKEYINDNGNNYVKKWIWAIAISYLSLQFVYDNLEEILDTWNKFDGNSSRDLVTVLSDLTEEMKLKKSETLINWALNSDDPKVIIDRISIIYELPVKLDNPENYETILNKLIQIEESEDVGNGKFYFPILKRNIIESLPDYIVKKNYKDIIEKLNTMNEPYLRESNYIELIQKITMPNADLEMEDEELLDALEYVCEKCKERLPDAGNRITRRTIEILPVFFVKQNYKEIIERFNSNEKMVFSYEYDYIELIRKLVEPNDDFKMENEQLLEAIKYIGKSAKETLPDSYDGIHEEIVRILQTNILAANMEFIEDNLEDILNIWSEIEEDSLYALGDFLSDLPEETKLKKSETMINWALNSDNPNVTKDRISIIYNFPVKLDNPENYEAILNKIVETEAEANKEGRNDKLYFSLLKQNIIKSLPDYIVKQNYKDIIEKLNTIDEPYLRERNYIELIQKITMPNVDFEMGNDELLKAIEYVEEKGKERFPNSSDKMFENIVKVLPTEFVETNIEYILTRLGEKISTDISLQLLDKLSGESISKYKDRLNPTASIDRIEFCQKYLEYVLQNGVKDIINDNFALETINLVDSLPNDGNPDYEKIKNILKDARNKIVYPDMEKYDKFIPENYSEKFEEMNLEDFDSFIKALENIKIIDGTIPEKYCDYMIKQKLNKNSNLNKNLDKYLTILKISFQDKVKYMLEREGISGYKIEFFENDGKGTLGSHNHYNKKIDFLEDNLIELDESNTHMINTAFHEVRHAVQAKDYKTTEFEKLNGDLYNMIKEEVIRRDDFAFYTINYSRMFCEIDARIAGAKGQSEYLKYLGISDDKVIESSGEKKITLKELYLKSKEVESENQRLGGKKVSGDGKIISVSQKAAELIIKNPDWLKRYPVLSLEFKENGKRKSSKELLAEAIKVQNANIQDIYRKMFESEIKVGLKDVSESLEYIDETLENKSSNSETITEFASLIIKNEAIKSLENTNTESEDFKKIIETLKRIKEKNPELEISKYIEEKLRAFSEKNEIEAEKNTDLMLSYTAINWIMIRKINSMEDFDKILEDVKKVSDGNKYGSNIEIKIGLIDIIKKQLKSDTQTSQPLDVVSMFEKSLDVMGHYKPDLLIDFVDILPDEMLLEKMPDILKRFVDKSGKITFETAVDVMYKVNPEMLKQNENLGVNWFERIS